MREPLSMEEVNPEYVRPVQRRNGILGIPIGCYDELSDCRTDDKDDKDGDSNSVKEEVKGSVTKKGDEVAQPLEHRHIPVSRGRRNMLEALTLYVTHDTAHSHQDNNNFDMEDRVAATGENKGEEASDYASKTEDGSEAVTGQDESSDDNSDYEIADGSVNSACDAKTPPNSPAQPQHTPSDEDASGNEIMALSDDVDVRAATE